MKRILLYAMLAAAPASLVFAATATGPAATQPVAKPEDTDSHLARMQEQMQRMQDEIRRMRETQDPQARQQVMKEHMQTMHAHMQSMHAMMQGNGMMGGHRGGGMMHGSGQQDMMAQCMQMMQQQPAAGAKPEKR